MTNFFLILFVIIIFFLVLELISKILIKKTFLYKSWYFKPHIFVNFLSNDEFIDKKVNIDSNNFRSTGLNKEINSNLHNLYLLGCCNFFEPQLKDNETFSQKLEKNFTNVKVLNPSLTHYTHYHMLNRLIYDIKNSHKIDYLITSASVNDVLVYIHHKHGKVKNDYSHYYKTFLDKEKFQFVKNIPSSFIQIIILFFNTGNIDKLLNYETHFYDLNKNFELPSNYKIAEDLFDFSNLTQYLNILLGICKRLNIELILTTFAYKVSDFIYVPRPVYLKGIKQINNIYRNFAKENNITLIDFENEIHFEEKDIDNKWHFCDSGNKKRSDLATKILKKKYEKLN